MILKNNWIAFYTIVRKEIVRFLRIWMQTLLPPVINQALYFVIFGAFIGSQIKNIHGVPYMAFIVPGLVMMAVITSSFANVVSSFFGAKFNRNIEELMVSPTPNWIILAGFTIGGVLRGILVGIIIFIVSAFFTHLEIYNLGIVITFIVLTSILFALAGFINALFATKFDDISIFPTFILTPLTYFGGVFYSIKDLPVFWQNLSRLNPVLYMIDGFRYGFFGASDVNVAVSAAILVGFTITLATIALVLLKKGAGLKT
ncbi:MAG: ABC transporter permease [Candidatus Gracilibacteria bacterium]